MNKLASSLLTAAFVATSAKAAVFTLPKTFPLPQASVTVGWDSMSGATNYVVYFGDKSRAYTNYLETTSTAQTIPVTRGSTNYIAVTQMQRGLESAFSAEVVYIAPAGPPPPTNVVQVSVVVEGSTNMSTWIKLATLPSLTYTNPPDPIMTFRSYLTVTKSPL